MFFSANANRFLPRDTMQALPMLSRGVLLSVCPSRSVILSKRVNVFFSPLGSHAILVFFRTKHHDATPTGTSPLTGTSIAGGVGRNRDSEPIYGSIACCQRYDQLGAINTVPPYRGKLRHLSLVVSGGEVKFANSGKRRRNVYDKKSECYVKDNRTAFNCNKRLLAKNI